MKAFAVAAILLAMPVVVQAQTTTPKNTGCDRCTSVQSKAAQQTPAACVAEFERSLKRTAGHQQLLRIIDEDKALVIVSDQESTWPFINSAYLEQVKITLWKAVVKDGKTTTEKRVYRVTPGEVDEFVGYRLESIARSFVNS